MKKALNSFGVHTLFVDSVFNHVTTGNGFFLKSLATAKLA